MAAESDAHHRRQEWCLVVRRSFGIPDVLPEHEAQEALIHTLEEELHRNGWLNPARGIAEPMVEALLALGTGGDDPFVSTDPLAVSLLEGAAYRLIDKGMTIVDPENLVFDLRGEYPREIVAAAQLALERVSDYVRGQRSPVDRRKGSPSQ